MCERLNEAGWDVEINAEPGRFIAFAREVLNVRFAPEQGLDWDVAIMFLGVTTTRAQPIFDRCSNHFLMSLASASAIAHGDRVPAKPKRSKRHHPRRRCAEHECSDSDWAHHRRRAGLVECRRASSLNCREEPDHHRDRSRTWHCATLVTDGEGDCLPTLFIEDETQAAQEAAEQSSG